MRTPEETLAKAAVGPITPVESAQLFECYVAPSVDNYLSERLYDTLRETTELDDKQCEWVAAQIASHVYDVAFARMVREAEDRRLG